MIVGWGFYIDSVGGYYSEVGRQGRRFFYQLHTVVPSVSERTIVLIQDGPRMGQMAEWFTTMVLRAYTGSQTTHLLSDAVMRIEDVPGASFVRLTHVCNDLDGPPNPDVERGYWARWPCPVDPATGVAGSRRYELDRERIVWLRWNATTFTLELDEQRSAMHRVDREARSLYGRLLYPDQPLAR